MASAVLASSQHHQPLRHCPSLPPRLPRVLQRPPRGLAYPLDFRLKLNRPSPFVILDERLLNFVDRGNISLRFSSSSRGLKHGLVAPVRAQEKGSDHRDSDTESAEWISQALRDPMVEVDPVTVGRQILAQKQSRPPEVSTTQVDFAPPASQQRLVPLRHIAAASAVVLFILFVVAILQYFGSRRTGERRPVKKDVGASTSMPEPVNVGMVNIEEPIRASHDVGMDKIKETIAASYTTEMDDTKKSVGESHGIGMDKIKESVAASYDTGVDKVQESIGTSNEMEMVDTKESIGGSIDAGMDTLKESTEESIGGSIDAGMDTIKESTGVSHDIELDEIKESIEESYDTGVDKIKESIAASDADAVMDKTEESIEAGMDSMKESIGQHDALEDIPTLAGNVRIVQNVIFSQSDLERIVLNQEPAYAWPGRSDFQKGSSIKDESELNKTLADAVEGRDKISQDSTSQADVSEGRTVESGNGSSQVIVDKTGSDGVLRPSQGDPADSVDAAYTSQGRNQDGDPLSVSEKPPLELHPEDPVPSFRSSSIASSGRPEEHSTIGLTPHDLQIPSKYVLPRPDDVKLLEPPESELPPFESSETSKAMEQERETNVKALRQAFPALFVTIGTVGSLWGVAGGLKVVGFAAAAQLLSQDLFWAESRDAFWQEVRGITDRQKLLDFLSKRNALRDD